MLRQSLHNFKPNFYSLLLLSSYAQSVLSINNYSNGYRMGSSNSTTHTNQNGETHWFPEHVVISPNEELSYGMLILNRPIEVAPNIITNLWKNAKIRVLVDKGSDRWLSFLSKNKLDPAHYKPDLITGDFDSASSEGIRKFQEMGVEILPTPDQSATDFQKAVKNIISRMKVDHIVSVVESNGRLDHLMSNINTLYKSPLTIYLLSEKYVSWILRASGGLHTIHLSQEFTRGKKTVGLIPVGHPVHGVYSTGLKWNLDNATLSFGGLVSSSNTYESESVEAVSVRMKEGDVFWIMQLPLVSGSSEEEKNRV